MMERGGFERLGESGVKVRWSRRIETEPTMLVYLVATKARIGVEEAGRCVKRRPLGHAEGAQHGG